MAYSFDGRIRFSEVGEDGCLTLPGILNYFQDCSTFQSESLNQGILALKERGRVWVLSSWQVVVERYPKFGEKIVTSTWPYAFKGGFMGMRNFVMDTAEGERLAWANSIWSYLDIEKGVPVRMTGEDLRGYDLEEKLDMEYAPRKISLPKEREKAEPFPVQKHHLDTNHHVNNCQYISMASDYLPAGFVIGQVRAEYRKQVFLNDLIYPEITREDGKITVNLADAEGKTCTIVEFIKK